jgi:hypothetical protein
LEGLKILKIGRKRIVKARIHKLIICQSYNIKNYYLNAKMFQGVKYPIFLPVQGVKYPIFLPAIL